MRHTFTTEKVREVPKGLTIPNELAKANDSEKTTAQEALADALLSNPQALSGTSTCKTGSLAEKYDSREG